MKEHKVYDNTFALCRIKTRISDVYRRFNNIQKLEDYPESSGGWVKHGRLNMDYGTRGSFFDPYVIYETGVFYMYVSFRDDGTILRFESQDGVNWEMGLKVLSGSDKSEWDSTVNRASIVRVDDNYYMWYTGQHENQSRIGLARSHDGVHFDKIPHPVLEADKPYEGVSVMNPCVIVDDRNRLFRMWYAAGDNYEPDVICYAESTDGIVWDKPYKYPVLKKGNNKYDCFKVGGCDVKKIEEGFVMYYIAYQNVDNACICEAFSKDGLKWDRMLYNPIIYPTKGSWDCHAVYKPSIIIFKDKAFLWYNGRKHRRESIGLAIKRKKSV